MKERREFAFAIRLEADLGKMHQLAKDVGLDWSIVEPYGPMDEDEEPTGGVEAGPCAEERCRVEAPILFRMAGILAETTVPQNWNMWVRGKLNDDSVDVAIPLHSEWYGVRESKASFTINPSVIATDLAQRIEDAKRVLDGGDLSLPPF